MPSWKSKSAFMKDVVQKPDCPEYNGYNVSKARNLGQSPMPKTKTAYLPLIHLVHRIPIRLWQPWPKLNKGWPRICVIHLWLTTLQSSFRCEMGISGFVFNCYPSPRRHAFINEFCRLNWDSNGEQWATGYYERCPVLSKRCWLEKKFPQNIRALRMLAEAMLLGVIDDRQ